jgi:hypothetical protein
MVYYTEVPVMLRFRSKEPIGYDALSHRLQLSGLEDLAEFVILERPTDASKESWALGQKYQARTEKVIGRMFSAFSRPLETPKNESVYRHE